MLSPIKFKNGLPCRPNGPMCEMCRDPNQQHGMQEQAGQTFVKCPFSVPMGWKKGNSPQEKRSENFQYVVVSGAEGNSSTLYLRDASTWLSVIPTQNGWYLDGKEFVRVSSVSRNQPPKNFQEIKGWDESIIGPFPEPF